MAKTLGVIVGRFQTPYLHWGHSKLIIEATDNSDAVLVGIGSANAPVSNRNPLPVSYRKHLVEKEFEQQWLTRRIRPIVVPLNDMRSDDDWSKQLDDYICWAKSLHGLDLVRIWTDKHGFQSHYTGQYKDCITEIAEIEGARATEFRKSIGQCTLVDNKDWAKGVVWATQQGFPQVIPTVDIACAKPNNELLIGRKLHEDQWRLPGGFVDITDTNFLSAAKRELSEEVGHIETSDWHCVNSFQINDWRMDGKTQKIITTLFSCYHIFGAPVASDDLAEIRWIMKIKPDEIVPEHREMFEYLKRF